jgi:hypothetical protein
MNLKLNFTNPAIKKGMPVIFLYAGFLLACYLLEKAAPSGSCNPGLGFLLVLLLPFISAVLLALGFIKLYQGKKENKVPVVIHTAVLIIYLLLFYTNIHPS